MDPWNNFFSMHLFQVGLVKISIIEDGYQLCFTLHITFGSRRALAVADVFNKSYKTCSNI